MTPTQVEDWEQNSVLDWEVEQMVLLGLGKREAIELAEEGVGWHQVADLLEAGCPPALILRLLP